MEDSQLNNVVEAIGELQMELGAYLGDIKSSVDKIADEVSRIRKNMN